MNCNKSTTINITQLSLDDFYSLFDASGENSSLFDQPHMKNGIRQVGGGSDKGAPTFWQQLAALSVLINQRENSWAQKAFFQMCKKQRFIFEVDSDKLISLAYRLGLLNHRGVQLLLGKVEPQCETQTIFELFKQSQLEREGVLEREIENVSPAKERRG